MKIIGITGTIGCGKTLILEYLKGLGAKVIDSDKVARELSEPGQPLYNNMVEGFGTEFLKEDSTLDRKKLRDQVFGDDKELQKLNDITRKTIVRHLLERIMRARDSEVLVIENVRLFELELNRICDQVWFIVCDHETQIQRIMERDGARREQAKEIVKRQENILRERDKADYIIDNSGTIEETIAKVTELYHKAIKGA